MHWYDYASRDIWSLKVLSYIGNFSRREILAKMMLGKCVKFSPSPIFAISRTLNKDLK